MKYIDLIITLFIFIGIPCFVLNKLRNWGLLDLADRMGIVFDALIRYAFYILALFLLAMPHVFKDNLFNFLELFNYLPETYKLIFTVKAPLNEVHTVTTNLPQAEELKKLISVSIDQYAKLNNKLESVVQELQDIKQLELVQVKMYTESHNGLVDKLVLVAQNTGNLKSGISALQSSLDVGFKNINISLNTFNERSQEMRDVLSYMSNISAKNLESLYTLNNQFLVSSAELSKINSTLVAHQDVTTNGFTALHKSLETSAGAQADLQSQLDLVKQRQTDLNYKNYVENQKLAKELESFKVETRAEIEANKPKVMVTEAKVSSSWFNSLFSSDKKQP